MNNLKPTPLIAAYVFLCLVAFVFGFVLYFQSSELTQKRDITDRSTQFSFQTGEWKSTIEKLEQFNPIKSDTEVNTQPNAREDTLVGSDLKFGNENRITLLGLLKNEIGTAIIKNSWIDENQKQRDDVLRLHVGESTPDGWKLLSIKGDLSIWLNEQSGESLKITLFDTHNKNRLK